MKMCLITIISTTRKWQIKTTQYTCENEMAPVADCLQYHTAQYGTIASFGWDTSASTVATSQTHLVNQYYDICIRRTRSYCSICYTPAIISSTTGTSSSYGLGAGSDASAQKSAIGAICTGITIVGSANPVVGVGYGDYLEIANMLPSPATSATYSGDAFRYIHTAQRLSITIEFFSVQNLRGDLQHHFHCNNCPRLSLQLHSAFQGELQPSDPLASLWLLYQI